MQWYTYILLGLILSLSMGIINSPLVSAATDDLITINDFEYRGAFRLPGWDYGGAGLSYNPQGDPNGNNDNYPGSLFGIGHDQQQLVSEVSIPEPVISRTINELPVAATIQSFADVTGGLRTRVGVDKVGDVLWFESKLYWTVYEYYNAAGEDYLSHGVSSTNLQNPQSQGVWHLGPQGNPTYNSMKTADYLFVIDQQWAEENDLAINIMSGRTRQAGAFGSTKGPALFAFQTPQNNPPYGSVIEATPLVWYGENEYPNYRACDAWSGGAFVRSASSSAVIIVGSKGLGETYYGVARPTDCTIYKGYHCGPYEPQILLYNPAELAQVAKGTKLPGEIIPYAIFKPQQYFFDSCEWIMGGVGYDRERNILYIIQLDVNSGASREPIVHVFTLPKNQEEREPNPPPNETEQTEFNQSSPPIPPINTPEQTAPSNEETDSDNTPAESPQDSTPNRRSSSRSEPASRPTFSTETQSIDTNETAIPIRSDNNLNTINDSKTESEFVISADSADSSASLAKTNTPLSKITILLFTALGLLVTVLLILIIRFIVLR